MLFAIITTENIVEVYEPADPQPSIEVISKIVAGAEEEEDGRATFAAVFGEDVSIYFNDNGKLLGLDINIAATQLAHRRQLIAPEDFIVGDVAIFGGVDEEGLDKPVTEKLLEELH